MSYNQVKYTSVIICLGFILLAHGSPISNNKSSEIGEENSLIGLYNMFGGGNPKTTPEGRLIIEGDIVESENGLGPRKAVPDPNLYWPNGEVIYTYHESINQMEMNVIEAAMQHWRDNTCITFRPKQANDYIFIRFRSDTQGCWSLVGRQADRIGQGQDVSIGAGCANLNIVVHEIGHVLGFFHEQSRSDRDQYIDINWDNVMPGFALQFRKEMDSNYNIPYDLMSTMQYPQWAFSKEIFEKSTIVSKDPAYQRFLSKNYPLSFRDRSLANLMYSCTSVCGGSRCSNGGYMRAVGNILQGRSCSCDCPPNFSGPQCENQIRSDYYEDLPCGGVVTKEGKIETPDYPRRTAPEQSCMWDIRAPVGSTISIKFDDFQFAPRFTKVGTKVINKCFNETVEIRLKSSNIYDGDTYCGSDLSPGTILRSDGPRAVIIITANDRMVGRGLSARVRFLKEGTSITEDEENEVEGLTKPDTSRPTLTTSTPPMFSTLRPILPPLPPSSIVTTSSLLEEYEKESRKTLPPVIPIFQQ